MNTESEKRNRWIFLGCLVAVVILISAHFSLQNAGHSNRPTVNSPPPQTRPSSADESQPEIEAAKGKAAALAKFRERYRNFDIKRDAGKKLIGVAVRSDTGKWNYPVTLAITQRLKSSELQFSTTIFTPEFVSDGLIIQAVDNSREVLRSLDMLTVVDGLLLASQAVQYSTNRSLENTVTASMNLEVNWSPSDGKSPGQTWRFLASGVGFKPEEARVMAEERLLKQIAKDTNMTCSF